MQKSIYISYIILTLILCFNYSYAQKQKVKYDDDTIKVDGKPYAILKKKYAAFLRNDYVVTSLSGTELIYFQSMLRPYIGTGFKFGSDEELYYEVNFTGSGSQAELKHYYGSGFAKLIVENNLLDGNAIDPVSEKRFILLHHGIMGTNTQTSAPSPPVGNKNSNIGNSGDNNSNSNSITVPKSKSPVVLVGNKIMRDEKVIGKFRQDTTTSTYSQKTVVIIVYAEGGDKIAEVSAPIANPKEWNIKILSENKTYIVLYDSPNERENLFKWLSDKNYLGN